MYLWSRGEGEHQAEGKNSFEVQSGFWTTTRTVVDKVMGYKGSRVKKVEDVRLLWSRGGRRTSQ